MCDDQLIWLFDIERDGEGNAKITAPKPVEPTLEQVYRRKCYVNGVTDQSVVDQLWADEQKRRSEREKKSGKKKGRRR